MDFFKRKGRPSTLVVPSAVSTSASVQLQEGNARADLATAPGTMTASSSSSESFKSSKEAVSSSSSDAQHGQQYSERRLVLPDTVSAKEADTFMPDELLRALDRDPSLSPKPALLGQSAGLAKSLGPPVSGQSLNSGTIGLMDDHGQAVQVAFPTNQTTPTRSNGSRRTTGIGPSHSDGIAAAELPTLPAMSPFAMTASPSSTPSPHPTGVLAAQSTYHPSAADSRQSAIKSVLQQSFAADPIAPTAVTVPATLLTPVKTTSRPITASLSPSQRLHAAMFGEPELDPVTSEPHSLLPNAPSTSEESPHSRSTSLEMTSAKKSIYPTDYTDRKSMPAFISQAPQSVVQSTSEDMLETSLPRENHVVDIMQARHRRSSETLTRTNQEEELSPLESAEERAFPSVGASPTSPGSSFTDRLRSHRLRAAGPDLSLRQDEEAPSPPPKSPHMLPPIHDASTKRSTAKPASSTSQVSSQQRAMLAALITSEQPQQSSIAPPLTASTASRTSMSSTERSIAGEHHWQSTLDRDRLGSDTPQRRSHADFVIAVIGARGVGKTTIIHRGLRKPLGTEIRGEPGGIICYSAAVIAGGQNRLIEVYELTDEHVSMSTSGLSLPNAVPQIDGAMLCYDASNPGALTGLRGLLNAFWRRGGVNLIVLACKSSPIESQNAVLPMRAAEMCTVYGAGIVQLDGGLADPSKKTRNSFGWLIRSILETRGLQVGADSSSRGSKTLSAQAESRTWTEMEPRDVPEHSRHSSPAAYLRRQSVDRQGPPRNDLGLGTVQSAPVNGEPQDRTTSLESRLSISEDSREASTPRSRHSVVSVSSKSSAGAPSSAGSILIDRRSSTQGNSILGGYSGRSVAADVYHSTDEVIDKFLFAAVTGNDEQQVVLFLIIYRRFAAPAHVLKKLIERYEFVSTRLKSDPVLSRYAHTRLCSVLADWLEYYPGDFTSVRVRALIKPFLEGLVLQAYVSRYAIELLPMLRKLEDADDLDNYWACPDPSVESPVPEAVEAIAPPQIPANASSIASRLSVRPSTDTSRIIHQSSNLLATAISLLNDTEDAIAEQISRLTWRAYLVMSSRDLIRYILAPRNPTDPSGSRLRAANNPVTRAISWVNHLSNWVASVILILPRAKMRARMMEKMIGVAVRLRETDNYDALMGLLAGLNCQPLYRLENTLDLIKDRPLFKKFKSLNRLMSSTRSFSAYRMALSTSRPFVIPYIGCHLQDLARLDEGKSDMRSGLINWTKFQQMAKSAATVFDCHKFAPELAVDQGVTNRVMNDAIFDLNDNALYELSYQYQPRATSASSAPSALRRMFDNVRS
ncbi:uncharacterized protein L969DRAFT_46314 [Mixia osmundae IAM 14324]|uniref:Ras-GEF domain-containing protein n=1 Tax=Mixia osmundae (strain CBS 9802 / IAM 14324 / JCM 22182 / KY 12970) TaxID=764103 RepID=G7E6C7_MIXOS|nr:uncharacterized protein L969DRAFT_46314 [Mixia osmundae IAM 14324]KEI40456.1 hypothetical protein L969DRAFT_46314 [Mixia osmundae IAM 14324]GAA98387.1 hypothetical protein E5Q_05073 [Mixia osmundae IAM 14324]